MYISRPVTGSTHPRRMKSHYEIVWYWAPTFIDHGKIYDIDELVQTEYDIEEKRLRAVCFACGNPYSRHHRAHIVPRMYGGSDDVDNLHVLCTTCHEASEDMMGEDYWRWFYATKFQSWYHWAGVIGARRTGCVDLEHFNQFCEEVLQHYQGDVEAARTAILKFGGYKTELS